MVLELHWKNPELCHLTLFLKIQFKTNVPLHLHSWHIDTTVSVEKIFLADTSQLPILKTVLIGRHSIPTRVISWPFSNVFTLKRKILQNINFQRIMEASQEKLRCITLLISQAIQVYILLSIYWEYTWKSIFF